jgi:hypothetical protein
MADVLPTLWRMALRLAVLAAVVAAAIYVSHWAMRAQAALPPGGPLLAWPVILLLGVYVVLLGLPFVPGVEIGLAVLAVHGASAAPLVYGATVLGLLLAYGVGSLVPSRHMVRLLEDLRRPAAAVALHRWCAMPHGERLQVLRSRLPRWIGTRVGTLRYLALACLFNLPGNTVLGGGGGIALLAGLSRLFAPLPMTATVALAVAPVPLAIWIWGGMPMGLL